MSEDTAAKISLKLLVDRNANRVIFGEAGKDFVDFLFHFLSLPVGTVVKLLSAGKMIGSIGKIYESIEALDPNYMEPNINKENVLNPKVSSTTLAAHTPHLLSYKSHDDQVPNDMKSFYLCSNSYHSDCYNMSDEINTKCPRCRCAMSTKLTLVNSTDKQAAVEVEKRSSSGGYVKGLVTYMIMDDLTVKPMSNICSITLLSTFKVKDLSALESVEVSIGRKEAVEMLKASLLTDEVLTSMFLGKNKA